MRRGEIWWAELQPPQGSRPVLLLSRNEAIQRRSRVTVAPITRTVRGLPTEVRVGRGEGLPSDSVVNLDDMQTIYKSDLTNRIAVLSSGKMAEVEAAIKFALALP